MKRTLAIGAVSCLMVLCLAGCGENAERSSASNDYGNHYDTETKTYLQDGIGQESNTGAPKETTVYRNKNASANERLHGSSKSMTGTVANPDTGRGSMLGKDEEKDDHAARVRYLLMLDNAYVRDRDGFLFDGENAHHSTW